MSRLTDTPFTTQKDSDLSGIIDGNARQVLIRLSGAACTAVYDAIASLILLKLVDLTIGLRVDGDTEREGLAPGETPVALGDGEAMKKIEVVVEEDLAARAIEAIQHAGKTDKIGDGKIFVVNIEERCGSAPANTAPTPCDAEPPGYDASFSSGATTLRSARAARITASSAEPASARDAQKSHGTGTSSGYSSANSSRSGTCAAVAIDKGLGRRALGQDHIVPLELDVEIFEPVDALDLANRHAIDEQPGRHERAVDIERVLGRQKKVPRRHAGSRAPRPRPGSAIPCGWRR